MTCTLSGVVMEDKTSSTDHNAAATSAGPSGGEDLHRQVWNYTSHNQWIKLLSPFLM